MALKKCKEKNIRAIAEAIRLNPNFTDTYKLEEMPDAIKDYIKDYQEIFDCLITNKRAQLENIQLPTNITKIRDYAFSNCTNLALTSLPESLTNISNYAFYNCTNLALTSFPESLTSIGYGAFNNCTNLKNITFKGTPQLISEYAFQACNNLKTINVPWPEGEVANAPWGATNATINYNYIN